MKKRLKINGIIMILALVAIVSLPKIFLRSGLPSARENLLVVLGTFLILVGQLFRVTARGYKSEHSLNGKALIQDGPYSLVRNPMYLGILSIGVGIIFLLFKLWVLSVFLVTFIIRYILLIFTEEKKLTVVFPKDYRDYCRKVPRFLPSWSVAMKTDVSTYLPLKLGWIKKEAGSIAAVLLGAILLKSAITIYSNGMNAYLPQALVILLVMVLFLVFILYLNHKTLQNS